MPCPLLISSQSDCLIRVFDRIHIFHDKQCRSRSGLLQKPTDLDLHCLLRQGMPCSAREGLKVHFFWFFFLLSKNPVFSEFVLKQDACIHLKDLNFAAILQQETIFTDKTASLTFVMLNKLRCYAHFQFSGQSDYLIMVVDINSHSEWQTVQIQISWLLQKPTDLDLHC